MKIVIEFSVSIERAVPVTVNETNRQRAQRIIAARPPGEPLLDLGPTPGQVVPSQPLIVNRYEV